MRAALDVHRRRQLLSVLLCVLTVAFVVILLAWPSIAKALGTAASAVVGGGVVALDVIAFATKGHR